MDCGIKFTNIHQPMLKRKTIINMLLLISSAKLQIVLLFSFKFSHFFNLRACKNDNFFIYNRNLEFRRFVNSNLSRVHESKSIPAS